MAPTRSPRGFKQYDASMINRVQKRMISRGLHEKPATAEELIGFEYKIEAQKFSTAQNKNLESYAHRVPGIECPIRSFKKLIEIIMARRQLNENVKNEDDVAEADAIIMHRRVQQKLMEKKMYLQNALQKVEESLRDIDESREMVDKNVRSALELLDNM